eukprot:TRINITY_DN63488_c0_g1_i1.p1 TRINITY_DN63488_c0_g1~~TRINITY_DN63488_c0_g1_i1.p1  ORF type:complete len:493 (-),score=102.55 TRINITY_DN63488_c0_g1_i1:27-1505(-)
MPWSPGILFADSPPEDPGPHASGASCGRCAVASRDFIPGEVAFRAPALAAVLHENCRGRRCDWCFTQGRELKEAAEKPLLRCGRCKATFYCGRACQEADWKKHHKLECASRLPLSQALAASGIPGDDALQDALLAGRCVRASLSKPGAGNVAPATNETGALDDLEPREASLHGEEKKLLRRIATTLATSMPALVAGESDGGSAAFGALCRFRNNNFAITDELFLAVGAGCYPHGAALNHSCRPNCLLSYELRKGEPPVQVVRVLEPVAAGHELTHSYVDLGLPSWQRQEQLREVYGFDCRCAACREDKSASVDMLLCGDARGTGAVAAGPCCPLAAAAPCAEREAALTKGEQLMTKAAAEEDASVELGLLEEVCRIREKWLHPRHIEVCAAHASAHTAAMAALNWAAAERHCQKLVEQYLAVYPSWHPITGLQMYTLAELKEHSGREREAVGWFEGAERILALTHGEGHPLLLDLKQRLHELGLVPSADQFS